MRLPRHCSVPIAYILSVYGITVVRFVDGIPKNIQHGLRLPSLDRLSVCKPRREVVGWTQVTCMGIGRINDA